MELFDYVFVALAACLFIFFLGRMVFDKKKKAADAK